MECVWHVGRTGFPSSDRTRSLLPIPFSRDDQTIELNILTGILLILVPIAFNVTFFLLQRAFEYPDILRKPTDPILRRFKEGGAPLRRLWYAFAFSAVLFTPVPVMVQQVFQPEAPWYLAVGTTLGVL